MNQIQNVDTIKPDEFTTITKYVSRAFIRQELTNIQIKEKTYNVLRSIRSLTKVMIDDSSNPFKKFRRPSNACTPKIQT